MNEEDKNKACTDTTGEEECCVEEVGEMVQRLVRVFQLFERDQIKVFGFTSSQCYTLLELLKAQSLAMSELSAKMNLDSTTMTRVLDNLVRDQLVERNKDISDRRYVVVSLTKQGKEVATQLNASIGKYYRAIIENIPEGQVDRVLSSVQLLLNAFDKANPNCC